MSKKWVIILDQEAVDVVKAATEEEAVEVLAQTLPEEDAQYMRENGYAYPLDRVLLNVAVPGWQLAAFEEGVDIEELEGIEEAEEWVKVDSNFDLWSPVL